LQQKNKNASCGTIARTGLQSHPKSMIFILSNRAYATS